MSGAGNYDDTHVTAREFLEHARGTDGEIGALRERQTKLESALQHVPADVADLRRDLAGKLEKLTGEVSALRTVSPPAAPIAPHNSIETLMLLLDRFEKRGKAGGNAVNTIYAVFGLAGSFALAWVLRGFFH